MADNNTQTILENLIDIELLGTYTTQLMTFINGAIAAAKTAVKNEIINGAPDTFDTLKEVSDYIASHKDEYDALMNLVGDKVSSADLTAAIERIVALETKVTTLTAEESTAGSVKAIAKGYADTAKSEAISAAATTAQSKVDSLANGQVATNKTDIATLKNKVESLENNGVSISLASTAQVEALFN